MIRHISGPEPLVRRVDLDVVVVAVEPLVPLHHEVSDAVLFRLPVGAAQVRRVGGRRVRRGRRRLGVVDGIC